MICKMRASFKTLQEIEENLLAVPVGLLQGLDDEGRSGGTHSNLGQFNLISCMYW